MLSPLSPAAAQGGSVKKGGRNASSQVGNLLAPMASVSFKIVDAPALEIPAGDAAQLGLHLAVFSAEDDAGRWRLLAEKIAVAVSQAVRGDAALLNLTESQRRDICRALDAMIDDRAGNLSDQLLDLRAYCR
jgi:hypothetical protein